jgi:hypothetical protein
MELLNLRLISKQYKEAVQSYRNILVVHFPNHPRWKQLFPIATYVRHSDTRIVEEHFHGYFKLEKLYLNSNSNPLVKEEVFKQVPHLKHLEVWSAHYALQIQLVAPSMFRHLTQLHTLKMFSDYDITDETLSYMPQLKRLLLDHCIQITSNGIRCLTQLIDLHIQTQPLITDTAFEGSKIQELYVNQNTSITDRGILSLKHLQKLTTCKTNLCGKGFQSLNLDMLYLNGVTLSEDYSDFKGVQHLILNNCVLPNSSYEKWTRLQKLQMYNTIITEPVGIYKIASLPHLDQFMLERCPSMVGHEKELEKRFGNKLLYKNLEFMYPGV